MFGKHKSKKSPLNGQVMTSVPSNGWEHKDQEGKNDSRRGVYRTVHSQWVVFLNGREVVYDSRKKADRMANDLRRRGYNPEVSELGY